MTDAPVYGKKSRLSDQDLAEIRRLREEGQTQGGKHCEVRGARELHFPDRERGALEEGNVNMYNRYATSRIWRVIEWFNPSELLKLPIPRKSMEHDQDSDSLFKRWRLRGFLRIAERALPIAHGRIRAFKQINCIDEKTRGNLLHRLGRCEARVAVLQTKDRFVNERVMWLLGGAMLLAVASSPLAILKWLGVSYGWLPTIGIWISSWFGMTLIYLIIAAPLMLFELVSLRGRAFTIISLFWFAFGLFTCVFTLYAILSSPRWSERPWYLILSVSSIVQTFLLVALMGAFEIVQRVTRIAFTTGLRTHAADAIFVDNILSALEVVDLKDTSRPSLLAKNALLKNLEDAAKIVSEGLPQVLRAGDLDTDTWLRNRCNAIAASLRAKKTWVCMPRSDTWKRLQDNLSRCLVDATLGNWDDLESAEQRLVSRQDIKVRVRTVVLGVIEALIPAGIYVGAQLVGFLKPGQLTDYLGFGVFLWAVIVILTALDPRFSEKLEAVQKVLSLRSNK